MELAIILTSEHLHPIFVHFPIAIILLGMVIQLIALKRRNNNFFTDASWYLLIIGALATIPAYLTGAFLTDELTGKAGEIQEIHEHWGLITLICVLAAALVASYIRYKGLQHTRKQLIVTILYVLTTIAIIICGYYGGIVAYEFQHIH
ncbi:MAG: DUF2231 domain-containing protein [Omnitrophica WOR_2 bacterium]